MPIYSYRCDKGHTFERLQGLADPDPRRCECGAKVKRQLCAPAIRFHGPGFHNTDYGASSRRKDSERD